MEVRLACALYTRYLKKPELSKRVAPALRAKAKEIPMQRNVLTLLAAAAVGLALSQAASAADMPAKAARPRPVPIPFSWTGFYVGIHAGYGWSNSSASATVPPPGDSIPSIDQKGNGVIGGGQIGYNWQFAPHWVIGVEGDISGTGIRNTTFVPFTVGGVPVGPGFTHQAERDIRWLATARGRLGYAADRWLVYVTGGGAWGEADYTAGPNFGGLCEPGDV